MVAEDPVSKHAGPGQYSYTGVLSLGWSPLMQPYRSQREGGRERLKQGGREVWS